MRRSRRQRVESTDFRKVSELVHDRRAERARNSETLRQNPEDAEAAVRTYRPDQRLQSVDQEAQQLVEDSRDIPRTWDPDRLLKTTWSVQTYYVIVLGANLLVVTLATIAAFDLPLPLDRAIAASIVVLAMA